MCSKQSTYERYSHQHQKGSAPKQTIPDRPGQQRNSTICLHQERAQNQRRPAVASARAAQRESQSKLNEMPTSELDSESVLSSSTMAKTENLEHTDCETDFFHSIRNSSSNEQMAAHEDISSSSLMSQTAHLDLPATRRVQHAHCTQTQLPALVRAWLTTYKHEEVWKEGRCPTEPEHQHLPHNYKPRMTLEARCLDAQHATRSSGPTQGGRVQQKRKQFNTGFNTRHWQPGKAAHSLCELEDSSMRYLGLWHVLA